MFLSPAGRGLLSATARYWVQVPEAILGRDGGGVKGGREPGGRRGGVLAVTLDRPSRHG